MGIFGMILHDEVGWRYMDEWNRFTKVVTSQQLVFTAMPNGVFLRSVCLSTKKTVLVGCGSGGFEAQKLAATAWNAAANAWVKFKMLPEFGALLRIEIHEI